jgi:hypothetical protein
VVFHWFNLIKPPESVYSRFNGVFEKKGTKKIPLNAFYAQISAILGIFMLDGFKSVALRLRVL